MHRRQRSRMFEPRSGLSTIHCPHEYLTDSMSVTGTERKNRGKECDRQVCRLGKARSQAHVRQTRQPQFVRICVGNLHERPQSSPSSPFTAGEIRPARNNRRQVPAHISVHPQGSLLPLQNRKIALVVVRIDAVKALKQECREGRDPPTDRSFFLRPEIMYHQDEELADLRLRMNVRFRLPRVGKQHDSMSDFTENRTPCSCWLGSRGRWRPGMRCNSTRLSMTPKSAAYTDYVASSMLCRSRTTAFTPTMSANKLPLTLFSLINDSSQVKAHAFTLGFVVSQKPLTDWVLSRRATGEAPPHNVGRLCRQRPPYECNRLHHRNSIPM